MNDNLDNIKIIIDYYKKISIDIIYILFGSYSFIDLEYSNNIKIIDITKETEILNLNRFLLQQHVDLLFLLDYSLLQNNDIGYFVSFFRKTIINNNINEYLLENSNKKIKIFINFKSKNVAYGGGNQFVMTLDKYLENFKNIEVTYELENDIDIYFIVDIRKTRHVTIKKYDFDQIYQNKVNSGRGTIIYRINDCDLTKDLGNLEPVIMKYYQNIDYYVFNSEFIKKYYFDKYYEFKDVKNDIIFNTADGSIYNPKPLETNRKIRIVTHHWSDNINKGYDIYHKLYQYCKTSELYEFVFVGRTFNKNYEDAPPIIGPFKGDELADYLRTCDIYITGSIHDACPMHVLEGLSCGLPILYVNNDGGAKNICELSKEPVGEMFNNFDDLIPAIEKIKNNYSKYYNNIIKNIDLYNSDNCYKYFTRIFIRENILSINI